MTQEQQQRIVTEIQQLKKSFEEMEQLLTKSDVPLAVLEDFKSAVDHIRTTVWALLSASPSEQYELSTHIARFRVKRADDMFRKIMSDIETQELTIDAPELVNFHSTLRSTLERIDRLYKSGI